VADLLLVAGTLNSDIGTAEEIERIEQELLPYSHSIDLEVLLEPEAGAFAETVESFQPHVFHFTGHSSALAGGKVSVLHFATAGSPGLGPPPTLWPISASGNGSPAWSFECMPHGK
jgi:hypothetical protein